MKYHFLDLKNCFGNSSCVKELWLIREYSIACMQHNSMMWLTEQIKDLYNVQYPN